jgi:cyclase
MKKQIKFSIYLGMTLMLAVTSSRAEDHHEAKGAIEQIAVTDRLLMLKGDGGNIGVSYGEDGILMIDDQYAPASESIKAMLDQLESGDIQFVLNTHWHNDHTGGNETFGKIATIISQKNVRKRLSTDQFIEFFNKTVKAQEKSGLPVITFDESLSIHFNGEEIQLIHFPGSHTDGDSVVYFTASNVLHTGDLFFNGFFPFIDLDHGGSVNGMIQSGKSLLAMVDEETKIIPGHGPLAKRADLVHFVAMLEGTQSFVAAQKALGLSLEAIQEMGTPSEWDSWKKGFLSDAKWIALVYKSLGE